MVTAPETVALLAAASGYDNRKPDQAAVRAWAEALADLGFSDAMEAIHAHYRATSEWVMPSDIIRHVRRVEAERVAAGPNLDELEPPERIMCLPDGPEFNAAYLVWLKEQRRRLRQGLPLEVGPDPVLSERQFNAALVS